MISHNRPSLGRREERAAVRAIRSGWVASGREAAALERSFAVRLGLPAANAVSVNSGSSALHLGLLALGIAPRDEVLVPTYACSALLNAVHYAGARPVPCDIRPGDFAIDPADALRRMTRRTQAVVVTHAFGFPGPVAPFRKAGLRVVEDGAQSLGASWRGRPVGSMGDAAVFSFGATKPMTGGAGGMAVLRWARDAARARDLVEYDQRARYVVRYNYALNDIAAAVARVQLSRLAEFITRRRRLAAAYRARLGRLPGIRFQEPAPGAAPSFYRFVIRTRMRPEILIRALARRGIAAIRPVRPEHLLHRYLGMPPRGFPGAEGVAASAVSIPVHPALSGKDQGRVIAALKEILS